MVCPFIAYVLLEANSNFQQLEFLGPQAVAIFLLVLFSYIGVYSKQLDYVSLELPFVCS